MGAVSTTDKTFGPFSEWDFSPKKTFPQRVMRRPATKRNNASNVHFVFGRFMTKPAFQRNKATICTFLARHEKTCFST